MKWPPFLSTFVLNKMCELIASGVRTEKGFKEVHLNTVAKLVFEFCAQEVTSTSREKPISGAPKYTISGALVVRH